MNVYSSSVHLNLLLIASVSIVTLFIVFTKTDKKKDEPKDKKTNMEIDMDTNMEIDMDTNMDTNMEIDMNTNMQSNMEIDMDTNMEIETNMDTNIVTNAQKFKKLNARISSKKSVYTEIPLNAPFYLYKIPDIDDLILGNIEWKNYPKMVFLLLQICFWEDNWSNLPLKTFYVPIAVFQDLFLMNYNDPEEEFMSRSMYYVFVNNIQTNFTITQIDDNESPAFNLLSDIFNVINRFTNSLDISENEYILGLDDSFSTIDIYRHQYNVEQMSQFNIKMQRNNFILCNQRVRSANQFELFIDDIFLGKYRENY